MKPIFLAILLCCPLPAAGLRGAKLVVARNARGQVLFLRNIALDSRLGKPCMGIPASRFYAWDSIFIEAGQYYSIDPVLVKAMYIHEGGLKRVVRSRVGAEGPGQIMPGTARRLGVEDPYDPVQAIWGSTAYLRILSDLFNGDLRLMVAGYNAGEEAVKRAGNKIPGFDETQAYVPAVLWTWDLIQRQVTRGEFA